MRFGAIQLPTAIDGSVDAEVSPGGAMSAEAQHAFMKQKAEQRARQMQEQQGVSGRVEVAIPVAAADVPAQLLGRSGQPVWLAKRLH
jgi:hypothetical protein